jgi:hypothetical protein
MGGATSKLDENDWEKADGKLQDDEFTLDGSAPTEAYEVYYLTKKGVNQREFDVTDSYKNLLYTTRAVPGTIACFDLMGRGIDEYRLRVYVDIARRYWTVCRFDVPTFPGQKTDQCATEKLITEIDGKKTSAMPILYKTCLITVSWSRYLAVAALFGPPTAEMLLPTLASLQLGESASSVEDDTEDDIFDEASRISARMRTRAASEDETTLPVTDKDESKQDGGSTQKEAGDSLLSKESDVSETDSKQDIMLEIHPSASMPEFSLPADPDDEIPTASSSAHNSPRRSSAALMTISASATVGTWLRESSKTLREQSKSLHHKSKSYLSNTASHTVLHTDPLEGVIQLDKPLLLCQEIYNKLIGNHQSSLVSKERVLELLKQDRDQHIKDSEDETDNGDDDRDDPLSLQRVDTDTSPGNGVQEFKESGDSGAADKTENGEQEEKEQEQPLVGYWSWDNTFRVHRMKIHLAKGSDISLHIVLAIIANQVRTERNAIALSV